MITHVAIKDKNDKIWSLPKPNRHHNIIHLIHLETGDRKKAIEILSQHIQGFINDKGNFLTREEAWLEEFPNTIPKELFSENIW